MIHFVVKKLYLTDSNFLEEAEEIKKALPKIIKYLKDNKKLEEYKIERRKNSGIYYFDNYGIAIFYQKIFNRKVIEKIDISLPSENNVDISNLGKLLGIEILKQIL
jgi:putative alanyl-tRNA synthetase related protein